MFVLMNQLNKRNAYVVFARGEGFFLLLLLIKNDEHLSRQYSPFGRQFVFDNTHNHLQVTPLHAALHISSTSRDMVL